MLRFSRKMLLGGALAMALTAGVVTVGRQASAADHLDPPARTDPDVDTTPDKAADIADIYTWFTPTDLIIAMTFAGPQAASMPPTYDRDVLYTLNISNDADPTTVEFPINVRFGQDGAATGVQFTGIPGTTGPIVGPVESDLHQGNVIARAGLFDDPFFFDLQGFRATRSSGRLMFDHTRNFFNGQNDTAIVLQIPRSAIENGSNPIRIWGSTARFGGQI